MSGHKRFDSLNGMDGVAVFVLATGVAVMKKTWGWWR